MATIKAKGQITIVDLNDSKSVQCYLQNSGADVQIYNPDTQVYTPNYTSSGITIKPLVYVTGSSTNQAASCTNETWSVKKDGSTALTAGTDYTVSSTTGGGITIKKNLTGNSLVITYTAKLDANGTGELTTITATKTIIKSQSAGALYSVIITTSTGTVFDADSSSGNKIAKAQAYRGGTADTNSTYTWYYMDLSTGHWATTGTTGAEQTVKMSDVLNFQTYRVVASDTQNGTTNTAEAYITFTDQTDPYTVEVFSSTGDKILNGSGSTVITARVWRNGTKIEDESTSSKQFTYTWHKFDSSGNAATWTQTYTGATVSSDKLTLSGSGLNQLTIPAAEISTKATFYVEVSQ